MSNSPNRSKLAEIFQRVALTQEGFVSELTKVSGTLCSQQTVQNWLKREQVPAGWVKHIVKASRGSVEPGEIRPDVFGTP